MERAEGRDRAEVADLLRPDASPRHHAELARPLQRPRRSTARTGGSCQRRRRRRGSAANSRTGRRRGKCGSVTTRGVPGCGAEGLDGARDDVEGDALDEDAVVGSGVLAQPPLEGGRVGTPDRREIGLGRVAPVPSHRGETGDPGIEVLGPEVLLPITRRDRRRARSRTSIGSSLDRLKSAILARAPTESSRRPRGRWSPSTSCTSTRRKATAPASVRHFGEREVDDEASAAASGRARPRLPAPRLPSPG